MIYLYIINNINQRKLVDAFVGLLYLKGNVLFYKCQVNYRIVYK